MSTQRQSKAVAAPVEAGAVEDYLKAHPDFFEQRPQLLALMKLSHPDTGAAVSLIERQVSVLREQNRALEHKLMDLVQIARDNETLSRQLHGFSSELLKAQSLSDVIATAQDKIRELFNTDFVALRLLKGITDDDELALGEESLEGLFDEVVAGGKPACGRLRREQLDCLFPANAEDIRSAAVIPLVGVEPMGLLGLASREEQQFNPTMGGLFLSHLGDLVSSALAVHIQ